MMRQLLKLMNYAALPMISHNPKIHTIASINRIKILIPSLRSGKIGGASG